MARPVLAALLLLAAPAAAYAQLPVWSPCPPVVYYWYPPVFLLPPACVCPPAAAPAPAPKPAAQTQGPKVYSEEKPVRPAGYAEPSAAPPEPASKPEPKADTIPKPNVPELPAPKGEVTLPKLPEPTAPAPKLAEPTAPDLKLPELPPLPNVSKYRPDPAADEVSVTLIPAASRANGALTADFYNYTGRELALTVDGKPYRLPARHAVAVAVGESFVWKLGTGLSRTDRLATGATGVEVVLK